MHKRRFAKMNRRFSKFFRRFILRKRRCIIRLRGDVGVLLLFALVFFAFGEYSLRPIWQNEQAENYIGVVSKASPNKGDCGVGSFSHEVAYEKRECKFGYAAAAGGWRDAKDYPHNQLTCENQEVFADRGKSQEDKIQHEKSRCPRQDRA